MKWIIMRVKRRSFTMLMGAFSLFFLFSCSDTDEDFDPSNNTDWPNNPANAVKILVDASHGGGGWWYPQAFTFSEDVNHQGSKLANHLRESGFNVDELGRGVVINDEVLSYYEVVIRTSGFTEYTDAELEAYQKAVDRGISLILISDHQTHVPNGDKLSEMLGLQFEGSVIGYRSSLGGPLADVDKFAEHAITNGINFIEGVPAASALMNADENSDIKVLGWFSDDAFVDLNYDGIMNDNEPTGMPYMGILRHPTSKIFFVTDINKVLDIRNPLVNNIVQWIQD